MKEIVARATIATDSVYNTGFIHIKDSLIEGVFTLDYVDISLGGNEMELLLKEHQLDFFAPGLVRHTIVPFIYTTYYPHRFLYIPGTYYLSDVTGSMLTLSLEEVIHEPEMIASILRNIELAKS